MKKSLLFGFLFTLCIFSTAKAQFEGGDGTQGDPFQISTPDQLNAVRNYLPAQYNFILLNDIDLTDTDYDPWTPIGTFLGVFDGDGYVISGINVNSTANYAGFFSVVGGTVKNLGVRGSVTSTVLSVGLLAGYLGQTVPSLIENCFADGDITTTVSSTNNGYIGLIVGNLSKKDAVVRNCYSKGSVTNTASCYSGGICGRVTVAGGTVENCYSEAVISGYDYAGGIAGQVISGGNVSDCYAIAKISGNNYVGGITGQAAGTVSNCYATGIISGRASVGGVAGNVLTGGGTLSNAVAANPSVTASGTNFGRVVGSVSGTINNVYGLESTLVNGSAIVGDGSATGKDGETKTLEELQEACFYIVDMEWDFTNVWAMPSSPGLPIFKRDYPGGFPIECGGTTTSSRLQLSGKSQIFCENNTLNVLGLEWNSRVRIYNATGSLVNDNRSTGGLQVNLPAKGIYFIEITHGESRDIIKIVNK